MPSSEGSGACSRAGAPNEATNGYARPRRGYHRGMYKVPYRYHDTSGRAVLICRDLGPLRDLQRRRGQPTDALAALPKSATMPEKRLTRSNHRTKQALTNHPAIIAYVCVGLVFCIVSCFKVFGHRRRRKFSKKQLERMRDWRDGRAETKVESQIRKMKDKLKTMKQRRRLERGRDAHERLLDEAEARRDARGREVYGDEWDNPDNDGL